MVTKTEALPYRDEEAALTGFLVSDDESADERPGILVIHGGGGLDDHAEDQARRYAALGFVVLACDMFGDGVAGDRQRVMATVIGLRDDPQQMSQRALAGLTALAARPQVDGRLAAIGFCFGGMAVLSLARAGADLAGAVSIHGSLATPRPAEAGSIRARVLVCHGALDPHVPMAQVTATRGFLAEFFPGGRANLDVPT
jgi:dienelactone hydrolase